MLSDCFDLEDSIKRHKLVLVTKPVVATDNAIVAGEVTWIPPKRRRRRRGIPFHEFQLIQYFRVKVSPSPATRFKLDQNRLCHSGFEDNELDILLYLCQQDEEFLKGYGYSLEQIEKCLTFLKANRQPALDR